MVTHNHYVYVYCDPRKKGEFKYEGVNYTFNYEPFYVGLGKGYRYRRHLTGFELDWDYNTIKNGKIKHLIAEGYDLLKYVVFYKDLISKQEAKEVEIELIRSMGRISEGTGILSNLTDGGDEGTSRISRLKGRTYEEVYGKEKANAIKEKRRQKLMGNSYGKASKGRKMSEETKRKLSLAKTMAIKQLTLEGKLIKVWSSAQDAANHVGLGLSSIHNVVGQTMRAKTAGGFRWEWVDRKNEKYCCK